eukprot:356780-Chlamydomonas_euryale.AAC.4
MQQPLRFTIASRSAVCVDLGGGSDFLSLPLVHSAATCAFGPDVRILPLLLSPLAHSAATCASGLRLPDSATCPFGNLQNLLSGTIASCYAR